MDVGLALEAESSSAIDAALLPRNCAVLSAPDESPGAFGPRQPRTDFYVVGTAHVSAGSCDDVRRVVQLVHPDVVMLELCVERRDLLAPQRPQNADLRQLTHLWYTGRASLLAIVLNYVLGNVSAKLGADLGEEMRVAVVEAQKAVDSGLVWPCVLKEGAPRGQVGAKVLLGDRPVSITLARTWAALSLVERVRFMGSLLSCGDVSADTVEQLRGSPETLTEVMEQLAAVFPSIVRPLIAERDEYMACRLRALAPKAARVVAIVGAGHVRGIRDAWKKDVDFAAISEPPAPRASTAWPLSRVAVLAACSGILGVTCVVALRRR